MEKIKAAAIILAGGSGRRFGRQKLLEPYHGGFLLGRAIEAALASPADDVVLVTGADAAAMANAAEIHARALGRSLRVVHAADHLTGLSASLRAGVDALAADTQAAIIFLGDMPDVPHALAHDLLASLASGHMAAAPVFATRRGHPVALSRALFGELRNLKGDRGAGALLATLGEALALIETDDPGVLRDIDRPEDLG